MLAQQQYRLGTILALVVILMFLIVSWFFVDDNYFNTSLFINAYALPPIFVLLTLMGLLQLKKKQNGWLKFRKGFKYCYLNQLIGGVLSLGFILLYMNLISPETRDVFNYQFLDTWYEQAKEELQEVDQLEEPESTEKEREERTTEILEMLKEKRDTLSDNLFSLSNPKFWTIFLGMNLFYVLNSVFLSMFFKTTKQRP